MQSTVKGSVVANSAYSRIGAPKKKPKVSSAGVSGETRWKSRMPEARAPLTEAFTCAAPITVRSTIWIATIEPATMELLYQSSS